MNPIGAGSGPLGAVFPSAPPDASRGDRAILVGLLILLAIAASATPIHNYDYWWHLATGRYILEHRSIPRADPFSFTDAGAPWIDHEWLFEVGAYVGHAVAGPAGLVLLKIAGVFVLGLLFTSHLAREGHGPAGIAGIVLPALVGSAFRLDVRPELCTLLLLPLIIHLVLRSRREGTIRPLLLVPALVALGSNLHVGILLAPPILALGACATFAWDRWLPGREGMADSGREGRRFAGRLLLVAIAAGLAAGFNPYGFRIVGVPFRLAGLLASLPSPNLEWSRPDPSAFPLFAIALAALGLISIVAFRRIDPVATPAAVLVGLLAAAHLRNIGLFFLLLPHGAARPARALVEALRRRRIDRLDTAGGRVRPGFIAATVLLLAGIPILIYVPPRVVWGLGIAPGNEPDKSVAFLIREGVGERLFNDVLFGGYLIWRRYPDRRVFIDGRNEVHERLLREIFTALRDSRDWESLLDRYRIDAALLRYPPTLQQVVYPAEGGRPARSSERAFAAAFFPQNRWALVYWDDDAMIVVRRTEGSRGLIARREYKAIHPDDWRYIYAGVLARSLPIAPILDELRRKLAEDPGCARARTLLGTFSGLAEALQGHADGGAGAL